MAKLTPQQKAGLQKQLDKERALLARNEKAIQEVKERIAGLEAAIADG